MFRLFKYISVLLLLIPASSVYAVLPTSLEKKELVLLVDRLNLAIGSGNYDAVVNNIPKRLSNEMAIRLGVTEQTLSRNQKEQLEKQFSVLGKDAFKMDPGNIDYLETPKGTFYALVSVRIEAVEAIIDDKVIFLHDATGWHMVFGGQKIVQNPVFQEIYPDFKDVILPVGKITRKNQGTQDLE